MSKMFKFNQEQKNFLYNNYLAIGNNELTSLFNNKFNTNLHKSQIKSFKAHNKLNSGLTGQFKKGKKPWNKGKKWDEYMGKDSQSNALKTCFKKGNRPHNHKPVGSERLSKDGYIEIKISEPRKWQTKHSFIYEQKKGKIPKGYIVCFADGNKYNFDIENLILVKRQENLIMNKRKLYYDNAECTKSGLLVAKILVASAKRR